MRNLSGIGSLVWLNGSDAQTEGTFRWFDGTQPGETLWSGGPTGSAAQGQYTNFGVGQPDDFGGNQDHLTFTRATGLWDDVTGTATSPTYVIQWDASEVLSSFTFSLTNNAGGRFAIDANTGEITVADGSLIDFEAATTHNIDIQVTDAGGNSYAETMSIAIDNGLDAAQTVPLAQTIDEDTTLTFISGTATEVSVSDTVAGTNSPMRVTLSVNDGVLNLSQTTGLTIVEGSNNSGHLVIDGTESDINAALDNMTFTPDADFNGSVTLDMTTALAADLVGHYTFEGANANDQSAGTTQNGTLASGAMVVNDPERGEVLSLDGVNDHVFINGLFGSPPSVTLGAWVNSASTGEVISLGNAVALRVGTGGSVTFFFRGPTGFETFEFSEIDLIGRGWSHVAATFDDVSDTVSIYLDGERVASETTTSSIDYSDFPNTYIGRNGSGDNTIQFNGLIDDARVYTRALSADEVAALASDQSEVSGSVAITVSPVNDAPIDLTGGPFNVNENATNGTVVGTVTGSDIDTGDTLSYSLTNDANGRFAIDTNTGEITVADGSLLDFETATSHDVTVEVSDGSLTYDEVITIQVGDVNEAPVDLYFGGPGSVQILDDFSGGIDPLTWNVDLPRPESDVSIVGNDLQFTGRGYLTTNDVFDPTGVNGLEVIGRFNRGPDDSFSIGTRTDGASDAGGWDELADGVRFQIRADYNYIRIQGMGSVTLDGGTVSAGLVINDDDVVSFKVIDDGTNLVFTVNNLTLGTTATISATSSDSGSGDRVAFYNREGAARQSTVQGLEIRTGITSPPPAINENAADGTLVAVAQVNDPDWADQPTYTLSNDASGRFAINSSTGEITVARGELIDYEDFASHNITVRVQDTQGASYSEIVTINVNDVAEAPQGILLESPTVLLEENFNDGNADGWNLPGGFVVSGNTLISASNDDDLHARWTDAAALAWTDISFSADLDLRDNDSHGLTVRVQDDSNYIAFTIRSSDGTVTADRVVGGVRTTIGQSAVVIPTMAGHQNPIGSYKMTVTAIGDTYTVEIDGVEVLSVTDSTYSNGTVGLFASTQHGGRFDNVKVTAAPVAVNENAANGTIVGYARGLDQDAGDTLTYTLTNNAGGRFAVDTNTGEITVADGSLLNFEAANSHSVTVQVSDGSLTYDETITIQLSDIPEPAQTVPGAQSVNEDEVLTFSSGNSNAVTVSDTFAGAEQPLRVSLSVDDGVLNLSDLTGLTIVRGGDGSGQMTIVGTESDINAALEGLTFTPHAGFNGSVNLAVTTDLDPEANLVGRYTFDDANAEDTGGGVAQDGAFQGGVTTVNDAQRGEVLNLDGVDDSVVINSLFGSAANVTLAAWVNLDGTGGNNQEIISLGDSFLLRADETNAGTSIFYYNGSSYQVVASNIDIAGSGWTHVAGTFDDANDRITLYINGVEVASVTTTNSISYTVGTNTVIGNHANGGTNFNFKGLIDDARVYDKALTAAEIAELADSAMPADARINDDVAITVGAVNDAPVVTAPGSAYSFTEQGSLAIHGTGFSLADVDDNGGDLTATFTVGEGRVLIDAGDSGVTIDSGNSTDTVTLIGTKTELNALLAGTSSGTVEYLLDQTLASDTPSASTTITLTVNDQGNMGSDPGDTGDGSSEEGSAFQTINITSLNDAPEFLGPELVTNGNFASGLTDWNTTGTVTIPGGAAQFGSGSVPGPHSLSQAIGTTAGETYVLEFDYRDINTIGNQQLQVSVDGGSNLLTTEQIVTDIEGSTFIRYRYTFVADSSAATITLTDTSDDVGSMSTDGTNNDGFIDNISVRQTGGQLGTASYTEDGSAVVLSADMQVFDAELSAADNFNGSFVWLHRTGGGVGEDVFSATGNLASLVQGGDITLSGINIGTVSSMASGNLILTFNASATQARVNETLQSIAYANTSDDPPTSVDVTWEFYDGNSGAQGSGGQLQATGSTTVNITAENDAPVQASIEGTALTYTENASAVAITSTLTVTDVDDENIDSAVVAISANYADGEDVLAFVDQNGITGAWNSGTGELTLTGTATKAQYETALRSITYANTSDDPSDATRTVSFTVNDGDADSNTQTRDINVTAVNDAPTGLIVGDVPPALAMVGSASQLPDGTYQLTPDSTSVRGAVWGEVDLSEDVTIVSRLYFGNKENGADGLAFAFQNQGDSVIGAGGGGLGVSGIAGAFGIRFDTDPGSEDTSALFADGQAGLATPISHGNLEDGNWRDVHIVWSASTNTLSYSIDGQLIDSVVFDVVNTNFGGDSSVYFGFGAATGGRSNQHLVDLITVENGPVSVDENSPNTTPIAVVVGQDPEPSDSLTYSIVSQEVSGMFAIDTNTGVITLADGTLLNHEADASHDVTVQVFDGSLTYNETITINVGDINETPIAVADNVTAVEAGGTANATAGTNPTGNVLDNDTDVDAGDTKTVVGVVAGPAASAVGSVGTGVAGSFGSITIAANGSYTYTVDNNNATVQALAGGQSTTDVFTYTMRDTAGLTSTAQITIMINGVNDAPVTSSIEGSALAYTENAGPVAITSTIALTDVDDSNIASAVVAITANFVSSKDTLNFTNQNGITSSWNGTTGTLTLTGSATHAQYETALRSITYTNNSDAPSTANRTVSFTVNDGDNNSNTQTRNIEITAVNDAPTVITTPTNIAYNEDDAVVITAIADIPGGGLTDVDNAVLGVAVTGYTSTSGTFEYSIDGGSTWNSFVGVSDTDARLLRLTDLVRFTPSTVNGGTLSINYRGWDQTTGTVGSLADVTTNGGTTAYSSNTAVLNLNTADVNDAPVLNNSGTVTLATQAEDAGAPVGGVGTVITSLVSLSGNVNDVDNGSQTGIAITSANTTNGTWWVTTDGGTTWNALGSVSESAARVLNANSNTRIYFQSNANYNGTVSDAITFRAWDRSLGGNGSVQGASTNGGTTAFSTATETADITITSVNDAPTTTIVTDNINLLTNGSFENGGSNWPITGNAAVVARSTTDGSSLVQFGAGDTPATGVVSQNITTVIGQRYTLRFDHWANASVTTSTTQSLNVQVVGSSTLINRTVESSGYNASPATQYGNHSFTFVANSTNTIIRFADVSATTFAIDGRLDDVRVFASTSNITVNENSGNGTAIGAAAAIDVDANDQFTYTLDNNASGRFAIDARTGQITLANGSLLDHETNGSHSITIRTTDRDGLFTIQAHTINVTDVNDVAGAGRKRDVHFAKR